MVRRAKSTPICRPLLSTLWPPWCPSKPHSKRYRYDAELSCHGTRMSLHRLSWCGIIWLGPDQIFSQRFQALVYVCHNEHAHAVVLPIANEALRARAPCVQNLTGLDDLAFAADELVRACQVFFRRSRRERQQ